MPIESIHTYLVHPRAQGDEHRNIGGIDVPLNGKLFDTLNSVYEKSDDECDIDIAFVPNGGRQQNDCRDLILSYIRDRSLDTGRLIANRLREHTTNRSKQGLLVLMYGREGSDHRLVISRYPTNTGILAEENARGLDVQFLERVFMRSAYSYKAAVYQHASLERFWDGRAVDKQISSRSLPTPEYWIHGFLHSDFRTTSAQGTRRLAVALKKAIGSVDNLELKQELVAAATLARGMAGQATSVSGFCDRFNLSVLAREAIMSNLPNTAVAAEQFSLDVAVFDQEVAYRTIQLDSGVFIAASAREFEGLVNREELDDGQERFSVTGHIINERLRRGSLS
ncbi:hypothetical protein [Glycocaulis alkaliphilus]|uniref:hypothetical protein n=1 Tax=Glycocaulis alkaliphilus TaxID=1434191 RepID=UPI000FDC9E1C|nr:hypothetical protein [Glycocaulis alkaliphilus]GGB64564.1 hypothetical protein GCM10007417_00330 [Glycocaulis alkaliphilus]